MRRRSNNSVVIILFILLVIIAVIAYRTKQIGVRRSPRLNGALTTNGKR
jgi:uncharacterized protein YpmB